MVQSMKNEIVLCTGCYDLLHRGHIDLLTRAAELGDLLIVGINSDAAIKRLKGPTRPINNQADRIAMLMALSVVDKVFVIDSENVADAILEVKPAVWVKGGDWTLETLNRYEVAAARSVGARIEIIPMTAGYSSTGIIERMKG